MKKSIFTKIGAAAMVLTLVTASLVGGTFAKYTSTVTAAGEVSVAKWQIKMMQDGNEITEDNKSITLTDSSGTSINPNVIAPGSEGELKFTVNGNGSEVGYKYTITMNLKELGKLPIKFYTNKERTDVIESSSDNGDVSLEPIEVAAENVNNNVDKIVYWKWVSDVPEGSEEDVVDTGLGMGDKITGTFDVTLTAEQLIKQTPTE